MSLSGRQPTGLAAAAVTGGIEFTFDRFTDWRSTLKPLYGADYLYAERILYEFQLSTSGAFAGEQTSHLVPSISDGRGYDQFTEAGGVADPSETILVRMLDSGTRYGRVRLVVLDTDGTFSETGPWAAAASGSYDADADPEWVNRQWTGPSGASLANCRLLLGELWGGSLSTGANQTDYLRINIDTFNIGDSVPAYFRQIRDTIRAGAASGHPGKFGFFSRAEFGLSSLQLDATTGTAFYLLQGGRNVHPQTMGDFNTNGGGTSPAMLLPFQCHRLATEQAGTTADRLLSLTADHASAREGEREPHVHYLSLYGCAHMIIDDTAGEPSDEDVARAYCLPLIVDAGGIPCFDVLYLAVRYNDERGEAVETPEARLVRACVNLGQFILGERLIKDAGDPYWRTVPGIGGVDAFDLIIDDAAYTAERGITLPAARVNVANYLKATEIDPAADLPATSFEIVRVNTTTSAYVAAGSGNADKLDRALIVARDLWHTWGGRVIPTVEPHTLTPDLTADQVADYVADTDAMELAKPITAHLL